MISKHPERGRREAQTQTLNKHHNATPLIQSAQKEIGKSKPATSNLHASDIPHI